jgi:prepilin-type N-terminal cleavage/methylation domain-containing protein
MTRLKSLLRVQNRLFTKDGFTLIEMMIVVAITATLAGMVVYANHSGGDQILLFTEQAKVVGLLNRARAYSLEKKVIGGSNICGFGVRFTKDTGTLVIFKDIPSGSVCTNAAGTNFFDGRYGGSAELVEQLVLNPNVEILALNPPAGGDLDVFFEPPYLNEWGDGVPGQVSTVTLQVLGTTKQATVQVGSGGEVTTL